MADNEHVSIVKPGDVLDGKYRVERVLGVGGMGVVVAARDIELNRLVAVKYITPEHLGQREHVERFAREARASVRLESEHAVRIHVVGRFNDGAPYMVMEYLQGLDLAAYLEQNGPLSPGTAVDYVLQACEAIAEAHAYGIVHRDLKPRNLFLTQRVDGRALIKVLDFGIAKSLAPKIDGYSSITRTTSLVGSPQYMSPEQMRSSKEIDTRTDIWSLGATLYELLTAVAPFDGNTIAEICAKVLASPAPSMRKKRPDLPEALDRVVQRCLEKEAALRFADVYQLALALTPFTTSQGDGTAARISNVLYAPPTSCDLKNSPSSDLGTTLPMFNRPGAKPSDPRMGAGGGGVPASTQIGAALDSDPAVNTGTRERGLVARLLPFAAASCAAGLAVFLLVTRHRVDDGATRSAETTQARALTTVTPSAPASPGTAMPSAGASTETPLVVDMTPAPAPAPSPAQAPTTPPTSSVRVRPNRNGPMPIVPRPVAPKTVEPPSPALPAPPLPAPPTATTTAAPDTTKTKPSSTF